MSVPLADPSPIPVLYDDEHLLVVDKPARCLVVDAPGRRGATAVDRVGRQLGERVYAVHRLDEDTTGVLVLARTEASREALEQVFRRHEAQRVYLALASRMPSPPAGRIESRLAVGRDGVVRSVTGRGGELAVTRFRTLERRDRHALLECELETGRRNQIRVHLSELGCPLVGDRKYGWRGRGAGGPDRPLLHAWRIRFVHPVTGEPIEVVSDPIEPELRPESAAG
jgi:23S rRNA pseudouridine1911/1915/1917 synthase